MQMVFANYLRQNLLEPLKERQRQEGIEVGRVEGRVEGRAESNAEWRDWIARREKAEAEGKPFDEPPPDVE